MNSVSVSVSPPLGAPALVEDVDVDVLVVAGVLAVLVDVLVLGALEEEPAEPQPASRPATITGTSETNRRID